MNWPDVATTIEALEHQYGGLVKLQIDREGQRGGSNGLWIRAMGYPGWSDFGERPLDVTTAPWPSNSYSTMQGCMFRLLQSLDHCLEARQKADSEGLPF